MSKAKTIIDLLEDYQSFIIHVSGVSDIDQAYDKVVEHPEAFKDAKLLKQKDDVIIFKDNRDRPIGQLIDVIRRLWNEDPRLADPDQRKVGCFKLTNGLIFFGVSRV